MSSPPATRTVHVDASPWRIGRLLALKRVARIWLVVDPSVNAHLRRWLSGLQDIGGGMGHREKWTRWSPRLHSLSAPDQRRSMRLILLAHHAVDGGLFSRLSRDDVMTIFSHLAVEKPTYVRHWSDGSVADEAETTAQERREGLRAFFGYWRERNERDGWEVDEWLEMGVSACRNSTGESLCCGDGGCEACRAFRSAADAYGVYGDV